MKETKVKNNSEIVNNTMCKSCLREHKEMTGHEPIDCAFKAFDNEYCEEAQELADYITNQDTKWQKLKEWVFAKHNALCKSLREDNLTEFGMLNLEIYQEIKDQMQELEEDDE